MDLVNSAEGERFNERNQKMLTAEDVRSTTKVNTLYVFVMGLAGEKGDDPVPGYEHQPGVGKVTNVQLLGFEGKLKCVRDETALKTQMPLERP